MKKIYIFILLLFMTMLAQAQIPNSGFENWTAGMPNGWWASSQTPADSFISRSGTTHSGSYSLRLNTIFTGGFASGPFIYSGDSTNYNFPISSIPQALYGWYIGKIVDTGDELTINSETLSGGLVVGGNTVTGITQPSAVFKQFIINYSSWTGGSGPDSAYIEFGIQNFQGPLGTGTFFIIDDLSFGTASTGIAPITETAVLEQCSPNPATGMANIIYSISGRSTVSLTLYDMVGQKVKTLLDDTEQTEGRYKVPTDVSELSNGVYVYSLNVNGISYSNKLVVSK